MRKILELLGLRNTVIAFTVLAVLANLGLTSIGYTLAGLTSTPHLLAAGLTALIIAPLLAIPVIGQLFKVLALEEENRRLATYDQLTGLMNRHAFMAQTESYIKFAIRNHSDFALIFIDLDDFKAVNDGFGHDTGDKLLQTLANTLETAKRESDLVARYGGDEFIILLLETNQAGAQFFADKLKYAISEIAVNIQGKETGISASMGLAISSSSDARLTLDEYLIRADQALYQAKHSGGNCSRLYPSPHSGDA